MKVQVGGLNPRERPVAEAHKYRIRSIPTQIFYDRGGTEVYRHEGFLDKASIVSQLERLGVEKQ